MIAGEHKMVEETGQGVAAQCKVSKGKWPATFLMLAIWLTLGIWHFSYSLGVDDTDHLAKIIHPSSQLLGLLPHSITPLYQPP